MRLPIKKIISLMLILAILLTTACGQKSETETTDLAPEENTNNIETPGSEKTTTASGPSQTGGPTELESIGTIETEAESENPQLLSKFSGTPISEEDNAKRPIMVMIDNHPDARMQAGFRQADMVFEMVVEGTYTRYMLVFHSQDAELVGPIRSARKYYIDRMSEFDALYTHFGGSKEARVYLQGKDDIDGMVVPSSVIWRYNDTGKFAPHNAYSNTKLIREYAQEKGSIPTTDKPGFTFYPSTRELADFDAVKASGTENGSNANNSDPLEAKPANTFHVSYFQANQSIFTYDKNTGFYAYNKDGIDQLDENDQKPLEITNIIIQKANYYPNPNYDGILTLDQVGSGEGYFVTRGQYVPITWEKADDESQTNYYIGDTKLTLNPGQTWILLVQDQDRSDVEFSD